MRLYIFGVDMYRKLYIGGDVQKVMYRKEVMYTQEGVSALYRLGNVA